MSIPIGEPIPPHMDRLVHFATCDPGIHWQKDLRIAIDVDTKDRSANFLAPNVISLPGNGYRMYYTVLHWGRKGYLDSRADIRSARSTDGVHWTIEPGTRIKPHDPYGALRVLCADVVPRPKGGYRMYFEAKTSDRPTVILSAISTDGLDWQPEPGVRLSSDHKGLGAPRCLYFAATAHEQTQISWHYRLYYHRRPHPDHYGTDAGHAICSARSVDGLNFKEDPGPRLVQEHQHESYSIYAPEVLRLDNGGYRMYYAAWSEHPLRGRIFTAYSDDGLNWRKHPKPCLVFGGPWDAAKVSEPCVIDLPDGRYRMFYEASDNQGQWRILSATSLPDRSSQTSLV